MNATPDSTISDTARQLNVTTPTIYKLIHKGTLHAYKVGRSTRVTTESIQQLRNGGISV